eukprot:3860019-Prymnesium_polylepis.1
MGLREDVIGSTACASIGIARLEHAPALTKLGMARSAGVSWRRGHYPFRKCAADAAQPAAAAAQPLSVLMIADRVYASVVP